MDTGRRHKTEDTSVRYKITVLRFSQLRLSQDDMKQARWRLYMQQDTFQGRNPGLRESSIL